MKHFILIFIIANLYLQAQFSGGNGTEATPYEIRTLAELEAVSDFPDKHFIQMQNITDSLRKPIPYFSGVFDGNNYTIILAIDFCAINPHCDYRTDCGLFQYINGAIIKNVVVAGYIEPVNGQFAGGVVGFAQNSEIYNCINMANIKSGFGCVGGIAGHFEKGKITHCINLGNVISDAFVGGIVGHFWIGNIINCINAGFISAENNIVGGIVGMCERYDYTLINCINTGIIEIRNDTNTRAGAIIAPY